MALCLLDLGASFEDLSGIVFGGAKAEATQQPLGRGALRARYMPLTFDQSQLDGAGELTQRELRAYLVEMRNPGAAPSLGHDLRADRKSKIAAYFSSYPETFVAVVTSGS